MVEVGGGLRSYRARGRDVLDPYGEADVCDGGRGQFLAPWPNRLKDGAFQWDGRSLQTAITEVPARNAIHGLVRWANWMCPEAESLHSPYTPQTPTDSVSLLYRLHPQPGWPWMLDFRVTYRLSEGQGLEVRTSVTNLAPTPSPVGFGWHPYLMGPVDDAALTLPAGTYYTADDRGIPQDRHDVAGTPLDFRRPTPIGAAHLDTAFTDLERDGAGRATVSLTRPDGTTTALWMDDRYTHLMVFTGDTLADPTRRRQGLAVEPMTAAPDMLNNGDGRRVLETGETLSASWGLDPFRNG